jgi:hypothetical protein
MLLPLLLLSYLQLRVALLLHASSSQFSFIFSTFEMSLQLLVSGQ